MSNISIANLPASIDHACRISLGHFECSTLGTEPAFVLCIRLNGEATVEFVNEVGDRDIPPLTVVWEVILGCGELIPILDAIVGLGLEKDRSVARMRQCVLAQLNATIYRRQLRSDAVSELCAILDACCVQGILNHATSKISLPQPCDRPELN